MNVLQVHHHWDVAEPGGIVAMMSDLMQGLERRGHTVTLLASDWGAEHLLARTDPQGRSYFRLNLAPIPTKPSDFKSILGWLRRFPLSVWRLRRFCQQHSIQVAQLHYADPVYLVFAAVRLLGGPPYVVTMHGSDVMGYRSQPALKRWAFQRVMAGASVVVAVSQTLADSVHEVSPFVRRLEVIYNGYTPAAGSVPDLPTLEAAVGRALPQSYAVLVGNCRAYKGIDIALHAWVGLQERAVTLPLVVVGGGPDFGAMQDLAERLGLRNSVIFLGSRPRDQAVALMARASLQVVPSRNEGQGIVVLEAGHAGTPVVCSNIGPFLEMVCEDCAFVFASEDPQALSDAVCLALRRPEEAQRRAVLLKERVRTQFSAEAMEAHYERLLLGLYEAKAP